MKTRPIVPARNEFAPAVLRPPDVSDVDLLQAGAAVQARRVFLAGSDLPGRWQGRDGFTIVEIGFGLGLRFLATWDAWRRDPQRSARLSFVSVGLHPPSREALHEFHRDSPMRGLVDGLVDAWPPPTPDLHRLAFDDGQVELLLAFGDAADWLPEFEAIADAFFLDGPAPAHDLRPWDARICKSLARLAARDATLVACNAAHGFGDDLARAGFEVRPTDGIGGDPHITLARFRPAHHARSPAGRRAPRASSPERRALIVGGGLAGTAVAWALAERGWRSTIFDRQPGLAGEASGNPAGLFHGTVHAEDGVHARFSRAAALMIGPVVTSAISQRHVAGAVDGVLRLETRLSLEAMRSLLDRLGLPASYVEALDADAASALAGFALAGPAWHYPGGGWVDPGGLARAYAARAGDRLETRTGIAVDAIRSVAGRWQLLTAGGEPFDEADTLILANAGDALRLIGGTGWPIEALRGQLSVLPRSQLPALLATSRLPVAAGAYVIATPQGLVFGATRQRGDSDATVRAADHADNVARLEKLVSAPLAIDTARLGGRTAWRWVSADRLPLIGAVPALDLLRRDLATVPRGEQPRHVPREPGLFVCTALGARGIVTSALGAQVLAAQVARCAVPLAASLVDAIDPARYFSRALRQRAAAASRTSQVVG